MHSSMLSAPQDTTARLVGGSECRDATKRLWRLRMMTRRCKLVQRLESEAARQVYLRVYVPAPQIYQPTHGGFVVG